MINNAGTKEIKINFPEKMQAGVYANNLIVTHTKEEFVLDFLMVAPPTGAVTARIVVSPGHVKRIINTLQESINKYESNFEQTELTKTNISFN